MGAWPTYLGGKTGLLRTSVVKGQVPCLISINALKTLGTVLDLADPENPKARFTKINKEEVPLRYAANGHLLLPLFQFDNA